jgi:hypothetical protein|tara:strand:- start:495 stop:653 length:159 start_codon:yes stop_codon:yes gene_type:complete
MADKGEMIKDQGLVPYAKQTDMKAPMTKPGDGKGKSRGAGDAIRGTKFTGVY